MNSVLKHWQNNRSPIALHRFAPEIRLLIFDYIIEGDGNTPTLMEALIGDQVLYREVVQEEYCSNELREEDGFNRYSVNHQICHRVRDCIRVKMGVADWVQTRVQCERNP